MVCCYRQAIRSFLCRLRASFISLEEWIKMKYPRFVKEYATYVIRGSKSNDMTQEAKAEAREKVESALQMLENGLLTVHEVMTTLTKIYTG